MEDHGSLKSQLVSLFRTQRVHGCMLAHREFVRQDEVIAEKDAAEREAIDLRVGGNADAGLKAEVERLKDELWVPIADGVNLQPVD
jgi:hypothetical protein